MNITIDGRSIHVEGRPNLLEIARKNDIFIPSLCDHPRLKPFTGCRLCLVEIKGRRDYAPACGTTPEEGMVVTTETPELRELRKGILELILSEHPYACLICGEKTSCDETKSTIRKVGEVTGCVLCPQNGRCDLQRTVTDLGIKTVGHPALYKNLDVRKEDPFFDRDPNTCILCGKCIRVCEEIRGASVLTFVSRGSHTVVGTALDRSLHASGCQFCGACVDVCPTSALVERAVRPQVLPERTAPLVCPFCGQGCALEAAILKGRLLFTRPAEDGPVNRGQACVRGRFLIRDTLHHGKRLDRPWIRKNGTLVAAEWEEALDLAADRLKRVGPGRTALGFSRQLGLEDAYVLLKFARETLGKAWLFTSPDASVWDLVERLRQEHDVDIPTAGELETLVRADVILNIGADLPQFHPMAWLRVVEALGAGADLVVAGSGHHAVTRHASLFLKSRPGEEAFLAAALASELVGRGAKGREAEGFEGFQRAAAALRPKNVPERIGLSAEEISSAAGLLAAAESPAVLFDRNAARGPLAELNVALIWNLALLAGARFVPLGTGSNDRGIFEIGRALGHDRGALTSAALRKAIRDGDIEAVVVAGAAIDLDGCRPEFLVCLDTHWNPLAEAADVVFPASAFGESDAVWVNTEGRIQTGAALFPPPGSSRTERETIAALAGKMGGRGFEFADGRGILEEISEAVPSLVDVGKADPFGSAFIREVPSRPPRFIAFDPPPPGRRKDPEYPYLLSVRASGDVYRNFEAARAIRGLGRLRPPGQVFFHPGDMESLGIEENGDVEILSAGGRISGTARTSKTLPRGTAETTLSGLEPGAGEYLTGGIVPVNVRRKI